eukprot:m.91186 g.91186  ORF g.91186 m.91186 type:complete len:441 (+) comp15029_c2_seq4:381-1703(+)
MGIDFRDGRYVRRIRFGKRTIKEGEAAAIWNLSGQHRQIVGPKRESLFFSTVRFLTRFTAGPDQYLVITYKNGTIQHERGPITMFRNPVEHENIEVKPAVVLQGGGECVVLYTEQSNAADAGAAASAKATEAGGHLITNLDGGATAVSRKIINGPATVVPAVGEWLHDFVWSGATDSAEVAPGANKFCILRTNRQHWTVKVMLRTYDNITVAVELTVSYQLQNIETLLENSEDPIADMHTGIQGDLATYGAQHGSDVLQRGIGEHLSSLDTFPQLQRRAAAAGFVVDEILFRGFKASKQLQAQHDEVLNMESKLRANLAKAEQQRDLADMELASKKKRATQEHDMEQQQQEHELSLIEARERAEHEQRTRRNQEVIDFLGAIKGMGVDLTTYLTSPAGQKRTADALASSPATSHLGQQFATASLQQQQQQPKQQQQQPWQ